MNFQRLTFTLGNMKILPILTEFVLGLIIMIYTNT